MSNVKPATDDQVSRFKVRAVFGALWSEEALSLIARIEADRAEIARLKAAHERDMCADGHERIRYTPAEDFGTCPLCVLRADNSTQSRLLALKDGEIASLKAEVERLTCPNLTNQKPPTPVETASDDPLMGMDAQKWAKEFMRIWSGRWAEVDEGLMISWFANAIMRGFDEGRRRTDAEKDAEIASLKAEVERLTPKCPVCLGHRTTTPAGNIPCQSCGGTGRAR